MGQFLDNITKASHQHAHRLQKCLEPIKKKIGVDRFFRYTIDKRGYLSHVAASVKAADYFYENKLYQNHPHFRCIEFYRDQSIYLFDHSCGSIYEKTQGRMEKPENGGHGLHNLIILINKNDEVLRGYGFGSSQPNQTSSTRCLGTIQLLNSFIQYLEADEKRVFDYARDFSVNLPAEIGKIFYQKPIIAHEPIVYLVSEEDYFAMEPDRFRVEAIRSLTPMERCCVRGTFRGRTSTELGAELQISYRTVEYHLSNAKNKCGVSHKSQLYDFLARWLQIMQSQ